MASLLTLLRAKRGRSCGVLSVYAEPCFQLEHDDVAGVSQAGFDYREKEFDIVFKRIYSIFGSAAPYVLYQDAQPFLRWVRKQGILVGVVSNASYRYRDIILPSLGLNQV